MTTVHSKMAMAMGMAELSQSVRLLLEAYWADLLAQHESSSSSSSSSSRHTIRVYRVSSREDQTIGAWEWLLHHFLTFILLHFYFWNHFVWFDFVFGSCLICPWCYPRTSLVFFRRLGAGHRWEMQLKGGQQRSKRHGTKAEEQMKANELNECRKIGHGTLDRNFSCRW